MQILTFDWFAILLSSVWAGFSVVTPVLLILRLLKKKSISLHAGNIQYASNLVLAVAAVFFTIYWIGTLTEAYRSGIENDFFIFYEHDVDGTGHVQWFLIYECVFVVCALLMFIPRLRRNWWMTLLAYLSLHIGTIVGFIIRLYSDYDPSPWTIAGEWVDYAISVFMFLVMVGVVYFLLWKMKGLPNATTTTFTAFRRTR